MITNLRASGRIISALYSVAEENWAVGLKGVANGGITVDDSAGTYLGHL